MRLLGILWYIEPSVAVDCDGGSEAVMEKPSKSDKKLA